MEANIISSYPRLKLSYRRDVERRLHELLWLLKTRYTNIKFLGEKPVNPSRLFSTQKYLESDKLGIVLRSILFHGYNAPIIVIRGYKSRLYVLDGHHRARVSLWLRISVNSFILDIPDYRRDDAVLIKDMELINPPNTPSIPLVMIWRHMANTIHSLEKIHGKTAIIWKERIPIEKLIATQKIIQSRITEKYILDEPILVYDYKNEKYVIDGHTRTCTNLLLGRKHVDAIVFSFEEKIGLLSTSERLGKPRFTMEFCKPCKWV